jgi:hypothetical protein
MHMQTDLDAIKHDPLPTRRALAMAQAIARYLDELDQDDPGDDEARFAPRLRLALCKADDLVNALHNMLKEN